MKHELSFIGVYGKSGAGKSLMLDKVLNLCEFSGAYVHLALLFSSLNLLKSRKDYICGQCPYPKTTSKYFLLTLMDTKKKQRAAILCYLILCYS